MAFLRRFRRQKDPSAASSEGCGYWIFASIGSLLLLCVNLAIVQIAYVALTPLWSDVLLKPRFAQATVLIAPALMVFIEWWLWEAIIDRLVRDKVRTDKRRRRTSRR